MTDLSDTQSNRLHCFTAVNIVDAILILIIHLLLTLNQTGQTALMFAAEYGHLNVIEVLIERGADLETKDQVKYCLSTYLSVSFSTCLSTPTTLYYSDLPSKLLSCNLLWFAVQ